MPLITRATIIRHAAQRYARSPQQMADVVPACWDLAVKKPGPLVLVHAIPFPALSIVALSAAGLFR